MGLAMAPFILVSKHRLAKAPAMLAWLLPALGGTRDLQAETTSNSLPGVVRTK